MAIFKVGSQEYDVSEVASAEFHAAGTPSGAGIGLPGRPDTEVVLNTEDVLEIYPRDPHNAKHLPLRLEGEDAKTVAEILSQNRIVVQTSKQ